MPRIVSIIAALLLTLVGCEAETGATGSPVSSPVSQPTSSPAMTETATPTDGGSGEVVEITVGTDEGAELVFDPTEVSVPAGATVRLTFVNQATVPHNLTFDEPIGAATATIVDPGAEETLEFTAPEPGEYTFVCTLHPGMEGTLVVEGD